MTEEEQQRELNEFEKFINRIKVTLNFAVLTDGLAEYFLTKIEELKTFIQGKQKEAGEGALAQQRASGVPTGADYWDQILDHVEKEIKEKQEQIQDEIEVKVKQEKALIVDGKLSSIVDSLEDLLRGFNTVNVARKRWNNYDDLDVLHESTGMYVIASQPGYFADEHVPAFKMLKIITMLVSALVEKDDRLKYLEKAHKQFEEAWWEGVDPNSKELKSNFLKLRRDVSAKSEASYNERLGEICLNGEKLQKDTPKSQTVERNIYNSIKLIAIVCATPGARPLQTNKEEQKLSVEKLGDSLEYAIAKQKRIHK